MNAFLKCLKRRKKENMYTKSFYIYFYRVYLQSFINRDFVFSIFTTLYGIGNIVIITLQLCVFALDTWYSLEQVCVASLSDVFIKNFPFRYCRLVEVDQMTEKSLLLSERNE